MADFEIYFRDLTPEAQKEFLMFQGISTAKAGNYDVLPIATIEGSEPELTELKLYCPLVVTIEPHTELGEDDEEPHEISSKAAHYFEQYVSDAAHLSMTDETSRGLMDYFYGSDEVNEKVYSMHPAVKVKNGELMGVCVLRIKEPLTLAELNEIREYATGQFSDGNDKSLSMQSGGSEALGFGGFPSQRFALNSGLSCVFMIDSTFLDIQKCAD